MLNVPSVDPSTSLLGKLVESLQMHEVIVQLIKTKCFPVVYYGLKACPLCRPESQFGSLNFVINSTLGTFLILGRKMLWTFVLKCLTVYRRNRLLRCATLNFRKELVILPTCCVRHLLLKPRKNWRPYKVLLIS